MSKKSTRRMSSKKKDKKLLEEGKKEEYHGLKRTMMTEERPQKHQVPLDDEAQQIIMTLFDLDDDNLRRVLLKQEAIDTPDTVNAKKLNDIKNPGFVKTVKFLQKMNSKKASEVQKISVTQAAVEHFTDRSNGIERKLETNSTYIVKFILKKGQTLLERKSIEKIVELKTRQPTNPQDMAREHIVNFRVVQDTDDYLLIMMEDCGSTAIQYIESLLEEAPDDTSKEKVDKVVKALKQIVFVSLWIFHRTLKNDHMKFWDFHAGNICVRELQTPRIYKYSADISVSVDYDVKFIDLGAFQSTDGGDDGLNDDQLMKRNKRNDKTEKECIEQLLNSFNDYLTIDAKGKYREQSILIRIEALINVVKSMDDNIYSMVDFAFERTEEASGSGEMSDQSSQEGPFESILLEGNVNAPYASLI